MVASRVVILFRVVGSVGLARSVEEPEGWLFPGSSYRNLFSGCKKSLELPLEDSGRPTGGTSAAGSICIRAVGSEVAGTRGSLGWAPVLGFENRIVAAHLRWPFS